MSAGPTMDDYKQLFSDILRADDVAAEKMHTRLDQLYSELSAEDQKSVLAWFAEFSAKAGFRMGYEAGKK